jgi:hypothetical protein
VLLAVIAILLAAHLLRGVTSPGNALAGGGEAPAVLRAQAIELVNKQGRVVAQLHLGDDGGGNLRLRAGDGTVRVKMGATADGGGLLLLDKEVEPAVRLGADKSGTRLVLAEKGKQEHVFRP